MSPAFAVRSKKQQHQTQAAQGRAVSAGPKRRRTAEIEARANRLRSLQDCIVASNADVQRQKAQQSEIEEVQRRNQTDSLMLHEMIQERKSREILDSHRSTSSTVLLPAAAERERILKDQVEAMQQQLAPVHPYVHFLQQNGFRSGGYQEHSAICSEAAARRN